MQSDITSIEEVWHFDEKKKKKRKFKICLIIF